MNSIEQLRKRTITDLLALDTMQAAWPTWQPMIRRQISTSPAMTAAKLQALGGELYRIFKSTSAGRSQSGVSGGGMAWEGLVCWYLNLCLIGSRTVVIRAKKAHVPDPISDAITVMYGSNASTTESDLLAITLPVSCYANVTPFRNANALKQYLNGEVTTHFRATELTVIQCKTNWNDNAQVPMLWDLIYRSNGFGSAASVGRNGFLHTGLAKFSYAFATVPTVNPASFKASTTAVLRVKALSGGNYWGLPSNPSVALNIFDLITKNFQTSLSALPGGCWANGISALVSAQLSADNYFQV